MKDLFSKKTVFVIGAGAHVPYGFPSGAQLRSAILDTDGNRKNEILKWSKEKNLPSKSQDVDAFLTSFQNTSVTIDQFLASRREYDFIGRCMIVFALAHHENLIDNNKAAEAKQDQWYRSLMKIIDDSMRYDPSGSWNPAFITFNYDRLLDFQLFHYCKEIIHKGNPNNREVYKWMESRFKIYHVFGQLDFLPGQKEGCDGREYGSGFRQSAPSDSVEKIRTSYFEIGQDEEFSAHCAQIREEIKKAERLIFLGFGFDEFNYNHILGIEYIFKDFSDMPLKEVYLSNIGLGNLTLNELKQIFNSAKGKSYESLGASLIKNDILNQEFNCSDIFRFIS